MHENHSLVHPALPTASRSSTGSVPGFPNIDMAWQGFCFPAAHSIGLRTDLVEAIDAAGNSPAAERSKRYKLAMVASAHEFLGHGRLCTALLPRLERHSLHLIHRTIRDAIEGDELSLLTDGTGSIPIPLAGADTLLSQVGRFAARLHSMTFLVQEVYAVWASLRHALQNQYITEHQRDQLFIQYRKGYGAVWAALYQQLTSIEDVLDATEVVRLARLACSNPGPTDAFQGLLESVREVSLQSQTLSVAALEAANLAFCVEFSESDQLLQLLVGSFTKDERQDLGLSQALPRLYRADQVANEMPMPTDTTCWVFDRSGMHICDPTPNDHYACSMMLSYSIWQQLAAGKGLHCPYWDGSKCCGLRSRLVQFFLRTRPSDRLVGSWQLQGCLKA